MPGILSNVGSFLSDPTVMALLPAVTGALGGALTSPRLSGGRGALGNALLGGTQGLEGGMQMAQKSQELQQNAQYYKLLNQQAAQALKDRQTDQPVVAGMLSTIAKSPMGKLFYGNNPPPDFSQVSPEVGQKMLTSQMAAYENYWKGQKPTFQHITKQGPDGKDHVYEMQMSPTGDVKETDLGPASQEGFELRKAAEETNAALRQQSNALMAGLRQQGLALQQSNAEFMHTMQQTREDDTRRGRFQTMEQNLAKHTADLAKMLSATTPADPSTVETLLKQRNAMAKQLRGVADKYGYDYEPSEFEEMKVGETPGTLRKLTHGAIGGSTPVLESGTEEASSLGPVVGTTRKPDGTYHMGGETYVAKGGKVYKHKDALGETRISD